LSSFFGEPNRVCYSSGRGVTVLRIEVQIDLTNE
jgi:hypothetical protein